MTGFLYIFSFVRLFIELFFLVMYSSFCLQSYLSTASLLWTACPCWKNIYPIYTISYFVLYYIVTNVFIRPIFTKASGLSRKPSSLSSSQTSNVLSLLMFRDVLFIRNIIFVLFKFMKKQGTMKIGCWFQIIQALTILSLKYSGLKFDLP